MRRLSASAVLLLLVACGSVQLVEVQDQDTLYFGTSKPGGGAVTEAEWRTFVKDVITPEYPGFTEWNATGHWQGAEELTHVVQIAHPERGANDERIGRIISEYKKRFQQQSVLWIRGHALVTAD